MAPLGFQFFCANSDACRFHDQSALNAVFKGKRQVLPPTYNYITDYILIGRDAAEARIIHFTGGLKPWYYFGTPWRERFKASYAAVAARYPSLAARTTTKSAAQQRDMQRAHSKRMALLALAFPPLSLMRRARFRRYLAGQPFALTP